MSNKDSPKISPETNAQLDVDLETAAAIKAEMTQLLRDLEQEVTGKPDATIGGWRHHPKEWAKENLS